MFSNESRGGGRGAPLLVAVAALTTVAASAVCLVGCGSQTGAGRSDAGRPGNPAPVTATRPANTGAAPTHTTRPRLPLTGKVVVLDPGHNPDNYLHTAEINRKVDIGNGRKECDTTGTQTNAGYPEARYTLDVSRRVRALLVARGARVVLTQNGDRPYGPCVDQRARIGNGAHADAALSIHADGAPAADYGFHVIAPKALHVGGADTRAVAAPSLRLAVTLRAHFAAATREPFADYLGGGKGLMVRDDLGGLNLSTVPKVFIECGNMRNARDAKSLTDPAWRQNAARGIADGLTAFIEDAAKGKG
ncbi:N-acetylmuramoyl-L-alanine amidase [Actinacidiphila sp. ITFR-21]|uniref:N-acetylmuramoyl-L-alanine amidase n=1 Tax=Actinacidiphila sp. ITFR-21 TaxID=3075199 RepID=UPI0028899646|nr:N-acetylmuramoyl-L-alanine amidase [Streptomyces sp. ITFR-21]WNI15327.1 N-acetylmuramoyl-L-alanine amidase [Streptomyces sp. ITFR-21]